MATATAVPFDQMPGVVWFDGKLVPNVDAEIHVLTHGLHYASAVFEGERAYNGTIFKTTEHSERLHRSAQILDFEIPFSVAEIDAAKRLIVETQQTAQRLCASDRLARLRATRRIGHAQHHPSRDRDLGMAELFRSGATCQGHPHLRLPISADPIRAPRRARQGLRSLRDLHHRETSRRAQRLCRRHDARLGRAASPNAPAPICSSSRTARFIRRLPIVSSTALPADSSIALASRRGIEVIERRIMPAELDGFSECFITGTAAEITAVSEIADWRFTPGAITVPAC